MYAPSTPYARAENGASIAFWGWVTDTRRFTFIRSVRPASAGPVAFPTSDEPSPREGADVVGQRRADHELITPGAAGVGAWLGGEKT